MRLRTRLILSIAFASLLPLGLLGWGAVRVAQQHMLSKEGQLLESSSDGMGLFVETWLRHQEVQLGNQHDLFEFEAMSEESRNVALRVIYRQIPAATYVTLSEGCDGRELAHFPPLVSENKEQRGGIVREEITDDRAASFHRHAPLETLSLELEGRPDASIGVAPIIGRPYLPEGRATPVLATLVPFDDGGNGNALCLAVELSLDEIAVNFAGQPEDGPAFALLNDESEFILASGSDWIDTSAVAAFLGAASELRYRAPVTGEEVVASTRPIPAAGWAVVVASPAAISEATARKIGHVTGYLALVSGVLCLLVGIQLSRQLAGPVVQLRNAAQSVADGNLGRTVESTGSGEIADLAATFNFMSEKLYEDAQRILEQQSKIEAFNDELQERIRERTRELQEAHERLLQSARLAAVGEMGAGLAHELNNPIAGILGIVQLLLAKEGNKSDPLLSSVEEQALRCKAIVGTLLGFSQDLSSDDLPSSERATRALALSDLTEEVLGLVKAPLAQRGVRIVLSIDPGLVIDGQRNELGNAFAQLFTSMCSVAPHGGELHVQGSRDESVVTVEFRLEASEIRYGSDDWKASGLGFWAARRVIARHRGKLEHIGDSRPGTAIWQVRFEVD